MKFDDINVDLIRCFVTVADCLSFTEAGERLHKSQSAISVRLKNLEERLGCKLLERTSRSVKLAPLGEVFLPYAQRLLALNDEAVAVLQTQDISGQLRIGIVEYFAAHHLPGLLAEIGRSYPSVDLRVSLALSSELFRALDADELDVVIAKADGSRSGGLPVMDERLQWVISDTYDAEIPESVPLCLMPEPCSYRQHALEALRMAQRPWRETISCSSVLGLQTVVQSGLGVGVLGASCILPDMKVLGEADGLPPLPSIPIRLFGRHQEKANLITPIVNHLCSVLDLSSQSGSVKV